MEWKAFELHCHTLNSDGQFSVEKLCRAAQSEAYEGLALTDHNTQAGLGELDSFTARYGLTGIHGIELTTFFGYILIIGANRYVDWRFVTPDLIDPLLMEVRQSNGIVGIAHPKIIGNPISTGSHWNFHVTRWNLVSYIEVWSRAFPQRNVQNEAAFQMWTDLLNRGFHIAATSGRDWHAPGKEPANAAATYLGINGKPSHESAVDAIEKGRMFVTTGPRLLLSVLFGDRVACPGEEGPAGRVRIATDVSTDHRRHVYERFHIVPRTVRLVHNGNIVAEKPIESNSIISFDKMLSPGWLRAELYGNIMDNLQLIAFTSPVYFV